LKEWAAAILSLSIITFLLLATYPTSLQVRVVADSTLGVFDAAWRGMFGYDAYLITAVIDIWDGTCTLYVDRTKAYAHEIGSMYVIEGQPDEEVTGNYTFIIVVNETNYYGAAEEEFHGYVLIVMLFVPARWKMADIGVKVIDNEIHKTVLYGSGVVVIEKGMKGVIRLRGGW